MDIGDFVVGTCIAILIIFSTMHFSSGDIVDVHKEVKEFGMVGKRFALQHDSNISGYNCVNYTRDLKLITDGLGFDTDVETRCRNKTGNLSCHRYLKLRFDFEPQYGNFVNYEDKYPFTYKEATEVLSKK